MKGDVSALGSSLAANWAAQTGVLVPITIRVASKTDKRIARDTSKIHEIIVINLSQLTRSVISEKVILSNVIRKLGFKGI